MNLPPLPRDLPRELVAAEVEDGQGTAAVGQPLRQGSLDSVVAQAQDAKVGQATPPERVRT